MNGYQAAAHAATNLPASSRRGCAATASRSDQDEARSRRTWRSTPCTASALLAGARAFRPLDADGRLPHLCPEHDPRSPDWPGIIAPSIRGCGGDANDAEARAHARNRRELCRPHCLVPRTGRSRVLSVPGLLGRRDHQGQHMDCQGEDNLARDQRIPMSGPVWSLHVRAGPDDNHQQLPERQRAGVDQRPDGRRSILVRHPLFASIRSSCFCG
jgi:hypothetical protein